jgi:hypothetical protein
MAGVLRPFPAMARPALVCELNASGTVTAINTWGANGLVSRRVGTTSTFYVYDPQSSVPLHPSYTKE